MSIYGPRGTMFGAEAYQDMHTVGSKRPRTFEPGDPYFNFYPAGFVPYGAATLGSNGGGGNASPFPSVRLRGLPFDCSDFDIVKFFAGLDLVDCLLTHKNGRFSGEAFVVFASFPQAELALERDQQSMGHRYIEVFPCRKQDYYHAVAAEVNVGAFPERQPMGKGHTDYTEVLKLRGLPFSATKDDVISFFSEFRVDEGKVHVAVHGDGRASGEAFVEFSSPGEAQRAMSKDRMMIGRRYVELFPSSHDEARRAGARFYR